jgi:hypothetical protein
MAGMRACPPPARRVFAHVVHSVHRAAEIAIAVLTMLAVLASTSVSRLGAQARDHERHGFDTSQGRLLGFYSAALAFTSGGPALEARPGAIELGLEATYVPYLTRDQRSAGSDKPQSSNLAPALPRPRLAVALPGRLRAEASWIPPLRVFDAQANLLSLAVSRPIGDMSRIMLVPRLAFTTGRIEGAITCNADLSRGSIDHQVYYANVCHGRESEDHFEPRHLSAELLASRAMLAGRVVPYASLGVRHERVRFDIGVINTNGTRDLDHPVLEMEATRPFALIGAQWRPSGRFATGTELFVAPGSLITARVLATIRLRGR